MSLNEMVFDGRIKSDVLFSVSSYVSFYAVVSLTMLSIKKSVVEKFERQRWGCLWAIDTVKTSQQRRSHSVVRYSYASYANYHIRIVIVVFMCRLFKRKC